jgi:hypothetical protein
MVADQVAHVEVVLGACTHNSATDSVTRIPQWLAEHEEQLEEIALGACT